MSEYIDPAKLDLDDQVVAINRITKVVKGGRRMRFAALVIVILIKGEISRDKVPLGPLTVTTLPSWDTSTPCGKSISL